MKIITIEEHYMDTSVAAASAEAVNNLNPSFRDAFSQGDSASPAPSKLMDLGEERLASMDANGIDIQVLSMNGHGMQFLSAEEAVPLVREANDRLATAISAHPDRFAGFASLPTSNPEAAAAELERAVNKLGFKGAIINGRTHDLFLDDSRFSPILEAAAAMNVPIYLHPTIPPKSVQDIYYSGLDSIVSAFCNCGLGLAQ